MNRILAEINIDALEHNFNIIKNTAKSKIMCVVKANAYGHGSLETAKYLDSFGADAFAVADVDEGVELRNCGIEKPILVLGFCDDSEKLLDFDITPAIFDFETAKKLSDYAVSLQKTAKIHIALDTGMSRIGFDVNNMNASEASLSQIKMIYELPNIQIEGAFSHFTTADEEDGSYTRRQFELFTSFCDRLEKDGINIEVKHIANSAATMLYPDMHLDMVRPGIILYGLAPSKFTFERDFGFKPVMTLKAMVSRIHEIDKDTFVGYGNTFKSSQKMKIATVCIGYADGYFRALSGKAFVMFDDKKLYNIGRICMDQCMFDATLVNNISVGDYVTIFGDCFTADSLAEIIGTIGYELVCAVSRRVPRMYFKNGQNFLKTNYLLDNIVHHL